MKAVPLGSVWEWRQDPRVMFAVVAELEEGCVTILYLDGNSNGTRSGKTAACTRGFIAAEHWRIA